MRIRCPTCAWLARRSVHSLLRLLWTIFPYIVEDWFLDFLERLGRGTERCIREHYEKEDAEVELLEMQINALKALTESRR